MATATALDQASRRVKFGLLLGIVCLTSGVRAQGKKAGATEAFVSIVVPKDADHLQRFAAQELGSYLERMTGLKIPCGNIAGKHCIYLDDIPGGLPRSAGEKLREALSNLHDDGFLLRSVGPDIVILGKGSRGTLYGCYAYLERLGVRWFFPGKEHELVPHRTLNWNTPLEIAESPAFRDRIIFYWPYNYASVEDWIDFAAKARLNRFAFHYTWPARDWYINLRERLLPQCQKRGMALEVGGHFLSSFLPRSLFGEHPNWFRLNERGERTNDFNLNPFNSEALEYLASRAVTYLAQMPEASLFHLWADDIEGGGWSHEAGTEEYTPSDQALLVCNDLVKRLRKRLPNANFAFLAYHDTVYPPRMVKPEPGIIYFYAPRERCYGHALNNAQCSINRKYSQAFEQALPTFGSANAEVFEYYVDEILYENMTNPLLPEVLSADARYYQQLGIRGVGALMTNTSEFRTPAVNLFLYPQALWDPQRDLMASIKEYASLYFGDAAMGEYFDESARGVREVLKICDYVYPGDAWDKLRVDTESDEALGHHVEGLEGGLRGPLARAWSIVAATARRGKDKLFRARLERERDSMSFTLLQTRLYYHLLKGELLFRLHAHRRDPGMALGVGREAVLARYTWEKLKRFVARSGLSGQPLIPDPVVLEVRAKDLTAEGYSIDRLYHHLDSGVSGCTVSGPSGSLAVVWTDIIDSRFSFRIGGAGLKWNDEFGQPLGAGNYDLASSPAVIEAQGMPVDRFFNALVAQQAR